MTESGFGHWVGSRPLEIGDRGEEAASEPSSHNREVKLTEAF